MTFIHNRPEFPAVIRAAAAASPIQNEALVEKDYWVTHALWALSQSGVALWFKGGTSLSKGFRITNRFSEDLDLVVRPGSITGLPVVTSWRGTTATATRSRQAYWDALVQRLPIPDVAVTLREGVDETFCNPPYRAEYRGFHLASLAEAHSVITPYVLLEFADGSGPHSTVAPSVSRPITSFLHDFLAPRGAFDDPDAVIDNRPNAIECVHPAVTLIEKLDAITRRYARGDDAFAPETFARHYEDAARIILALEAGALPAMPDTISSLAAELFERGTIRKLVRADGPGLTLPDEPRRAKVERAYDALALMFWVPQMPLRTAQDIIVRWLKRHPMPDPT